MDEWRAKGIHVNKQYHWPRLTNPADIATKGRGTYADVASESTWQCGPEEARHPRDTWPSSQDFVRRVPEETWGVVLS